MKFLRWFNVIVILTFITACGGNTIFPVPPTATVQSLPPPDVKVTSVPDATTALIAYYEALKVEDYNLMYSLLSKATQDMAPLEAYAKYNRDALNTMSAGSFDYEILSSLVNPYSAEVAYRLTYHTALIGDIQRDLQARFTLEGGQWKLLWDPGLILPELAGGNQLKMDYSTPSRGEIYDRNGKPLVAQSDANAFYILPGNVDPDNLGTLLSEVWRLCGNSPEVLAEEIFNTPAQYPIPLCEASPEESERITSVAPSGLLWEEYKSRYYFEQGVGSNVVGYTLGIGPEDMDTYRRLGYAGDETVGKAGIEQWAENYLAGKHGGTLYVYTPDGSQIVTRIAESAPQPSSSVYLTLDRNLQYYAEQTLRGFTGAIVVMERDTGRVLAMASSPSFDSNVFQPRNPNSSTRIGQLPPGALVNRATQGQYPLGSVFKIITLAAGMESGLFTPESTWDCKYEWTGLNDRIRYDWTYQHCQDRLAAGLECNTSDSIPSGNLTLSEGLMRSCNPFFWQIGYTLYQNDRSNDIANMARAFGLGSLTGIDQIAENPGQISDPNSDVVEVVNQSIGQGTVLVTPLQVARFIAAIGNGGTLYRPQLVESIKPVDGAATTIFKPDAKGTLPISQERLQFIQNAMISVVENPRGTANFRLRGLSIPVAGKTGTAESGDVKSHAWFAGYTMASQNTTLPDIAIAVVLEYQGEGSDWAAPMFKRMVEVYYNGTPQSLLWYEESILGPTKTPTPFGGIPTKAPRQ